MLGLSDLETKELFEQQYEYNMRRCRIMDLMSDEYDKKMKEKSNGQIDKERQKENG